MEKLGKILTSELSSQFKKFPDVFEAAHHLGDLHELVVSYVDKNNIGYEEPKVVEIPESFKNLTLNIDASHPGNQTKFFMTTPDEFVSIVSGSVYVKTAQIDEPTAHRVARKVFPQYLPRNKAGIANQKDEQGVEQEFFNTYVPPAWTRIDGYEDLPDELPETFSKLVKHLFPIKEEREYFFSWLWHSLFKRSFVYLVLCGAPGTGKNRLKLILRALHGHSNTIDGKRSTLIERFNSQLADSTLAWFDELKYDIEMENMMKELQNDSISIERKGIDATRSTRIYASLIISNNKPRDNYIAFDARKFAPLQVSDSRLETSMTVKEITRMTEKVEDWSNPKYDLEYIAQIGKWIKKHGRSEKWPQLEYKGPMFWMLAHTSMSRWQKKAATLVLEATKSPPGRAARDEEKGFLWSSIYELSQRKHGEKSLQFPDFSSVKHFFDIFRDAEGKTAFKTSIVRNSLMGDFWVKSKSARVAILTEAQVLDSKANGGKNNGEEEEEDLDL